MCNCWKDEALNVYLSGKAALEDGGFGDKFDMQLGCNLRSGKAVPAGRSQGKVWPQEITRSNPNPIPGIHLQNTNLQLVLLASGADACAVVLLR